MIVQAFLRWAETAKTVERAKAANALGRAYLASSMADDERRAAYVAMTYLLDDPSPRVRLALAEALADSPAAPRPLLVSLAQDQTEIACAVILRSPVLTDSDLVDLAGRGDVCARSLIAARRGLSRAVAAALAEIGDVPEIAVLLENESAAISRFSLKRIAERLGGDDGIRGALIERDDLPADARHLLVQHATAALSGSHLVQAAIGSRRIQRVTREADAAATALIVSNVPYADIPALVDHLRLAGRLTPAFLMRILCLGKADFFACAVTSLSGLDERRVRSILATGRQHAVRALIESAGLDRAISTIFVEAVLLWRQAVQSAVDVELESISARLLERSRRIEQSTAATGLLDLVEALEMDEQRRKARDYASGLALAAA
ncbi:DUF2336 domain-containing protein [Rhizobium sp. CG5]|uniref:DUF2336 domain-containing protein n=1 Tax=Rhizobium sp. CG5 TaxID=2726076 RepID=UPI002033767B|nr:DUF2336 domain-containing protein [Rhizobium sp. CG5]